MKTWSRDSHGLFDFESTQTKQTNAIVIENGIIVRKKLDIKSVNSYDEIKDEEYLMDIKYEKTDRYFLSNKVSFNMQPTEKNITDLQNKLWYIIKHEENNQNNNANQQTLNTNEDYNICLNDIIKLGRVKYSANEINLIKETNEMDIDQINTNVYDISSVNQGTLPVFDFIYKSNTIDQSSQHDEYQCKICLSGGSDKTNPMVALCKCTGGIKFTHYDCLKRWMHTKLSKKENDKKTVTSYNIKSFNCEICKTPYPFRFVVSNADYSQEIFDLIEIIRPIEKSFIILESLNQVKDNNNVKSIHVIILDGQKITLGRGHEADVRINDISVSRQHAVLIYDPNTKNICIRDLKSKFGTLALIKNDLKLKEKKIQLQIGRTFVESGLITTQDYEKYKRSKQDKKKINISKIWD